MSDGILVTHWFGTERSMDYETRKINRHHVIPIHIDGYHDRYTPYVLKITEYVVTHELGKSDGQQKGK
jgi:hypothetical protein